MAAPLNFIACPICKSVFPRTTTLCESCADELWRRREPVLRREAGFRVRSLFAWREGGPRAMDWLIRSLKGQDQHIHWNELALWMLTTSIQPQRPLPKPLLVPIPSTRKHSWGLARALSRWTGWPIESPLIQAQSRWQKGLTRSERQEVRFEGRGVLCTDYKTVLLVDDVITTGATLRAAHLALGRPHNCEAWCLMDRRPCGG
jgi:predicted amidophosphoribosyltransferase